MFAIETLKVTDCVLISFSPLKQSFLKVIIDNLRLLRKTSIFSEYWDTILEERCLTQMTQQSSIGKNTSSWQTMLPPSWVLTLLPKHLCCGHLTIRSSLSAQHSPHVHNHLFQHLLLRWLPVLLFLTFSCPITTQEVLPQSSHSHDTSINRVQVIALTPELLFPNAHRNALFLPLVFLLCPFDHKSLPITSSIIVQIHFVQVNIPSTFTFKKTHKKTELASSKKDLRVVFCLFFFLLRCMPKH